MRKALFMALVLSSLLISGAVDAATVTQPVHYAPLHLNFLLPTNMDGVTPGDRSDNCVSYYGPPNDGNQMVQICRYTNKHIVDGNYVAAWGDTKNDIVSRWGEFDQRDAFNQNRTVNGIRGVWGVFFYQAPSGTVFGNTLFEGETDNDVIIFLYQVPVFYRAGGTEGTDVLNSLDVFDL